MVMNILGHLLTTMKPELLEFYAEDSYVHGIELTMTYVPDGDGGLKETERKFWDRRGATSPIVMNII